jgi:hypothetical protein
LNMSLTKSFALLVFASAATTYAQIGTATISGTVTDPSKSLVAGVSVVATHVATGTTYSTMTNASGFYLIPSLAVGQYQVTAETAGFKKSVRTGITLEVDDKPTIDFTLEVGTLAESVEVKAEAPLVDSSSATLGKVVDNTRVAELPLNGRSGLTLVELTPNTRSQAASPSGFADRGTGVSFFTVNGGPSGANMQMIDGTFNLNPRQGDANINLMADAIQEFKVESGVLSAEYSYTLGGVLNTVTKSGTNTLHGTLYEFLRNNDLDARNFFALTRPPYRYNQYGGAVGGPVVKNKLFFFGNYEEWRLLSSYHALGTVPTPAERTGDLSGLKTATGGLVPIYDPASTVANPNGSGYVRSLFAGNIIPLSRLDRVAQNIMPFYPAANVAPSNAFTQSNNFQANIGTNQSAREEVAKVDYTLSTKDSLASRYLLWDNKTDNGATGTGIFPDAVSRVREDDYTNRNTSISETHIFTPNAINQLHLGVNRNYAPNGIPPLGTGLASKLGLPASVPNIDMPQISLSSSNGIPSWPAGFATFSGLNAMLVKQLSDSFSLIKGKHTLKLGFDLVWNQYNVAKCFYCSGEFFFNQVLTGNPQAPSGTGNGFASFLVGSVANASIQDNASISLVNHLMGYYVQDDWKLSRRLTLNLGLRWDYEQVPGERHDGLSNFNPTAIDSVNGLVGELQYAGPPPAGFGRTLVSPDYKNWSPRAGFAFDAFGDGKTVLRGGYGIYYAYTMAFADDFGGLGYKANTTTWAAPGNNTQLPAFQFQNGFPTPVVPPIGRGLGPAAFLGSAVTYDEPWGRTPYSQQFSFTVQRQLPKGFLLETAYSGNKGTHLRAGGIDLNELNPQYDSLGNALLNQVKNPYAGIVPGSFGAATITMQQLLKPYPYYASVTDQNPHLGSSIYHSLLISVEKRLSSGFVLLSSFTWGKSISSGVSTPVASGTVSENNNTYQNGKYDLAAERAIDSYDTPYRFINSLVYEVPFGPGKRWQSSHRVLNAIGGGWQFASLLEFEGGVPVVVSGANNNLATRPNSNGQSAQLADPTISEWFNTADFVNPPSWTYGNVSRDLPNVRAPGIVNIDLTASKSFQIIERLRLQIRGEAFNIANHPNFLPPNGAFVPGTNGLNSSGTFGTITAARDPRIIQVAMKLIF